MATPSLLVYGDASVDISLRIGSLPQPGLDTEAQDPSVTPGGSAANCATAAARLGAKVDLIARIGDDLFAKMIMEDLLSEGVGTSGVQVAKGPSALVVALIDPRGESTFVSSRGPSTGRIPAELYLPLLDEASMLHVSGYSFQNLESRATALRLLHEARRRGISTSLDPSPLFAKRHHQNSGRLEGIDYLFPNTHEAIATTGLPSPEEASRALRSLGAKAVVVTMGADGCLLNDESGVIHIPAVTDFPVTDTTGAGDGFAGGFLAVILAGGTPLQGCLVGNLVAARVIAEIGGHKGAPSLKDLLHLDAHPADPRFHEAVQVLAPSPARPRQI